MIYTLIGRAVVKGAKVFLRRKYGPQLVPKPVLAGVIAAAVVGAALAAGKSSDDVA